MKISIEKKNKIFFIEKLLKSIDDLRIVRYNKIKEREKREIISDLEIDKNLLLYLKFLKERNYN